MRELVVLVRIVTFGELVVLVENVTFMDNVRIFFEELGELVVYEKLVFRINRRIGIIRIGSFDGIGSIRIGRFDRNLISLSYIIGVFVETVTFGELVALWTM